MSHQTSHIRNMTLVGQNGSGKTTLLEKLLEATGEIDQTGSVLKGSTVSDFEELEKSHGYSIFSSACFAHHKEHLIQILDTPGYSDFRGPALAALRASETAAVVINAKNGVEYSTQRMMARAKSDQRCRMIIVNQIDADEVDLEMRLEEIRDTFGPECLPVNLPSEQANSVCDVFFHTDGQTDFSSVAEAHTQITEQVVEMDAGLLDAYLEEGDVPPEALHDAFEQALREGHLVPVCFVSAETGAGIPELLDVITRLLPSPDEGNPPHFLNKTAKEIKPLTLQFNKEAHTVAHVFKQRYDAYAGKTSFIKVYQGQLRKGQDVFIGHNRKPLKIQHLFKVQGKSLTETDTVNPGEICVLTKIDDLHYDSVLHDSHDEDFLYLEPIQFPQPMYGLGIEAATHGDESKLSSALYHLIEEDPCFKVEHNTELNETVILGLGEMHIKLILEKIETRYQAKVKTHIPRIAYRETITQAAEGHYRHKKQTGGAGQFGEVFLRVRPTERGAGFTFKNAVVGGSIPTNLLPAVEKGINMVLKDGAISGHQIQDIEVEVYDGKHHPVDSKEIAFVTAAKMALLDGIKQASPAILEPVVKLNVQVTDQHVGAVTGNLAGKRAQITGSRNLGNGNTEVEASVPQSELSEFHTELKAITAGQGRFSMDFSHYDPVPVQIQKSLISDWQQGE